MNDERIASAAHAYAADLSVSSYSETVAAWIAGYKQCQREHEQAESDLLRRFASGVELVNRQQEEQA